MARDYNKVKVTRENILIMGRKIARREAALCAILNALEENGELDDTIDSVDWDAADACANEEWLRGWFEQHRSADGARKTAAKNAALAKLTPAERKLLGIEA